MFSNRPHCLDKIGRANCHCGMAYMYSEGSAGFMEQCNSNNDVRGKNKAYLSITCGIAPIVIFIIPYFIGRSTIAIWNAFYIIVVVTSPIIGVIGIFSSRCAKRDGCARILANTGLICSIINILVTSTRAFIFSLLLFAHFVG